MNESVFKSMETKEFQRTYKKMKGGFPIISLAPMDHQNSGVARINDGEKKLSYFTRTFLSLQTPEGNIYIGHGNNQNFRDFSGIFKDWDKDQYLAAIDHKKILIMNVSKGLYLPLSEKAKPEGEVNVLFAFTCSNQAGIYEYFYTENVKPFYFVIDDDACKRIIEQLSTLILFYQNPNLKTSNESLLDTVKRVVKKNEK